jgi:hypothetical protein
MLLLAIRSLWQVVIPLTIGFIASAAGAQSFGQPTSLSIAQHHSTSCPNHDF